MTGHLMGAAGAIEAFVCAKVLETGCIPPTINLRHPDPELTLDYVPNEARSRRRAGRALELDGPWRATTAR